MSELLANKNIRGQSTLVGRFLAAHVDRPVSIETDGGSEIAILRTQEKGARKRLYWFEADDFSGSSVPDDCIAEEGTDHPIQAASRPTPHAKQASLESFKRRTNSSPLVPWEVEAASGSNKELSWV